MRVIGISPLPRACEDAAYFMLLFPLPCVQVNIYPDPAVADDDMPLPSVDPTPHVVMRKRPGRDQSQDSVSIQMTSRAWPWQPP